MAFGAVQPWAWASLAVIAGLLLILWAVAQVGKQTATVMWSPLYIPAFGFFVLGLVQYFGHLTQDPIGTREALTKLATDLILFFTAGQLLRISPKGVLRGFGFVVTIFAFSVGLFAIIQFFSSGGLIYWSVKTTSEVTFGPYVNHNHYAGLMEMLIPIAAVNFLVWPHSSPLRPLLGFALLVPVSSLLLSGSRGGFIALCVEIAILIAILLRYAPLPIQGLWIPLLGVFITAAMLVLFWLDSGRVSSRLATLAKLPMRPEVTLAERWVASRDSLPILVDHPWTGTGLGTFEDIFPRYQSFATDLTWDHAHDDYVEALAETGLMGGFFIATAMVLFLRVAFKGLRERLRHSEGWYQLGAILGCCGLLVHALVDFNFHIPANAAWFAVCAAMATYSGSAATRTRLASLPAQEQPHAIR